MARPRGVYVTARALLALADALGYVVERRPVELVIDEPWAALTPELDALGRYPTRAQARGACAAHLADCLAAGLLPVEVS